MPALRDAGLSPRLSPLRPPHLSARTADRIRDAGRQWIFVGAAAGALLGSRLLDLPEHPYLLLHPTGGWFCYFTNKTIVGGFLGGLVGVELTQNA